MTHILKRCIKEIPESALMFYGHNYGDKNLTWAMHLTKNKPDKEIIKAF